MVPSNLQRSATKGEALQEGTIADSLVAQFCQTVIGVLFIVQHSSLLSGTILCHILLWPIMNTVRWDWNLKPSSSCLVSAVELDFGTESNTSLMLTPLVQHVCLALSHFLLVSSGSCFRGKVLWQLTVFRFCFASVKVTKVLRLKTKNQLCGLFVQTWRTVLKRSSLGNFAVYLLLS